MVGGDWDFHDDLLACNTLTENYRAAALSQPTTRTGLLPNKYGLGWAVVSVPFYLIADGVVEVGRLAGWWTLARDGFNPVYQVALQTGHFALAVLALVLVHRVLRRWCGPDAAMRGLCLGWACSPMLYYQTSNLSMSHNVGFLAVAICLWSLLRISENPSASGWWILVGCSHCACCDHSLSKCTFRDHPALGRLVVTGPLARLYSAFARLGRRSGAAHCPAIAGLENCLWPVVGF